MIIKRRSRKRLSRSRRLSSKKSRKKLSRLRRLSSSKKSRKSRSRHFGSIDQDIVALSDRIVTVVKKLQPGSIYKDLTETGVIKSNRLLGYAMTFIPIKILTNVLTKFGAIDTNKQIDKQINSNIKYILDGIDPQIDKKIKIEIHAMILNLLLYPEILYAFLPNSNFQELRNLLNSIYTVLNSKQLIGSEVNAFLSKYIITSSPNYVTSTETQKYTDVLIGLFPPNLSNRVIDINDITSIKTSVKSLTGSILNTSEKDINFITNNLAIPILEDISSSEHFIKYKDELKLIPLLKPLTPLIETILYNHKNHKETEDYVKKYY